MQFVTLLCITNCLLGRDAMKQDKKGLRRSYKCEIKGCKAEPYASYGGCWLCEVHTKAKFQEELENESV